LRLLGLFLGLLLFVLLDYVGVFIVVFGL